MGQDLKPFWTTWRCRSNANLFIVSLIGFFISLVLIGIIIRTGFYQHLLPAFPIAAIYFGVWAWRMWRQMRQQQSQRAECGPLSRDELRKARSKLVKDRRGL
jgi:hypothetical protein